MTKTKKKIVSFMLLGMLAISLSLCFVFATPVKTYAAAITTPKYSMEFTYSTSTTTGTGGGTGSSTTSGKGYSVSFQVSASGTQTASMSIYGSGNSGTGTFPIGSYINSSIVNLVMTSTCSQGSITVTNSSGTQVGKGGKSLYLGDLADGAYNVALFFGSGAWATSARSGTSKSTSGSTSFVVDSTAPTISNASTSKTGKYTNTNTYVSASDSLSGVASLYVKSPSASGYSSTANGTTITSSSENGLYSFYAKDNAGNTSATYYLYLDTTAPTGNIYNSSGSAISGYTNGSFYYTATDFGSGISYMQYKTPGSTSWSTYVSETIISSSSQNGYYTFRATDVAGNVSEEKSIYLDTTAPTGYLKSSNGTSISGSTNKDFYFESSDSGSGIKKIEYLVPNSSTWATYDNKKIISSTSTNGVYKFRATDNAGNVSNVVQISLDTVAPTVTINNTSGTRITAQYINYSFCCYAADANSGIKKIEYMPAGTSSWVEYSNNSTIDGNGTNGVYKFRATDNAGNVASVVSITLDTVKPICNLFSNSGSVSNGGRTKGDYIYCSPTDNLSGVASIFVRKPNSGSYETYISGSQLAMEGMYYFYVKDNAGNTSNTCTLTLDKSAPSIGCLETDFYSTYGLGFTVSASDGSGETKLYYRVPSSSTFEIASTNTFVTDLESENGKYYFYAVDDLGNKTQTYWIELLIVYPDPTIENSTTDNSVRVTWTNGSTATINGYKYDKGTWITEEGDYTVIVTNEYGLQTEKQFSIIHNYVVISVVEPTCLEDGYSIFKCTSCGDEYVGNIQKAFGHNYKVETIEATCTTYGCIRHTCINCGDMYETDKTNALGHIYTETTRDATCTLDGGHVHTCTVCGYEYITEPVKALGHSYSTEVARVASCEVAGERHFHCDKCADEYYTDIPCTGHNFELYETETVDGKTVRSYVCTNCGLIKEQDMGEQYEKVSSYIEFLFDEYSPYMVWVLLATAGVWSIVMGVFFAIAQKNEDKEKARKMIKNYIIGIVVIFCIVVACPYLVKGIAALISG